jgi:hypothetical protein
MQKKLKQRLITQNVLVTSESQIINRTKAIINGDQLSGLNRVLELIKDFPTNTEQEPTYILIDNLDERWVDDSVKFLLIGALVERSGSTISDSAVSGISA